MALLSAGAVVASMTDDTGQQRVIALFETQDTQIAADFATQSEIADLSTELTRLRSETRLLALEKEAMAIKIAQLESEFGPITGSIPDAAEAPIEPSAEDTAALEKLQAAKQAAGVEMKPKTVRTIDVGFVPLPKARKNAIGTGEGDADASEQQTAALEAANEAEVQPAMAETDPNSLPAAGGPELESLAAPAARVIPSSVARTKFAVQLGIADTMEQVRTLWKDLSNEHDPLIGRLEPAIAIAEDGKKIRVRLLAGPFSDAADAIQLCALLIERGVDCRAVRSEGQKLVMR